jgi:hypothetical protein
MAVVINSFEAVAESKDQRLQKQEGVEDESGNKSAVPEPQDLARILHSLSVQALRSWAH